MARNLKMSDVAVNEEAVALNDLVDAGFLCIYDGAQPAAADDPVTTQNKLAELRYGSPAFGPALAGVITANPISDDTDAAATGTATWFRVRASDMTPLWDGSVGTSGCDLNLNSVAIQIHANVSVSSHVHTVTK